MVFLSPKSPSPVKARPPPRRSSVHQGRAVTAVPKFKMPGAVLSPRGVKTRARRSSIYQARGKNLSPISSRTRRTSIYVPSKAALPTLSEFSKVWATPVRPLEPVVALETLSPVLASPQKVWKSANTPKVMVKTAMRSPSPKATPKMKKPIKTPTKKTPKPTPKLVKTPRRNASPDPIQKPTAESPRKVTPKQSSYPAKKVITPKQAITRSAKKPMKTHSKAVDPATPKVTPKLTPKLVKTPRRNASPDPIQKPTAESPRKVTPKQSSYPAKKVITPKQAITRSAKKPMKTHSKAVDPATPKVTPKLTPKLVKTPRRNASPDPIQKPTAESPCKVTPKQSSYPAKKVVTPKQAITRSAKKPMKTHSKAVDPATPKVVQDHITESPSVTKTKPSSLKSSRTPNTKMQTPKRMVTKTKPSSLKSSRTPNTKMQTPKQATARSTKKLTRTETLNIETPKDLKKPPTAGKLKKTPAATKSPAVMKLPIKSPVATSTPSKNVEAITNKSFYSTPGKTPAKQRTDKVVVFSAIQSPSVQRSCKVTKKKTIFSTPRATPQSKKQSPKRMPTRKTPAVKRHRDVSPQERKASPSAKRQKKVQRQSPSPVVHSYSPVKKSANITKRIILKVQDVKKSPENSANLLKPTLKLTPIEMSSVLKDAVKSEKRMASESPSPRPRKLMRLAADTLTSTPRPVKKAKRHSPKKLAEIADMNRNNSNDDTDMFNETISTDSRSSRCVIL